MLQAQLSVITAAHPAGYQWLHEAGLSLVEQEVSLRWIVVADDQNTEAVAQHIAKLPTRLRQRTSLLATGKQGLGAAIARTAALAKTQTRWLAILDADDQWLPGGLDILLEAATSGNVSWTVGKCDELTSAGRSPFRSMGQVANQYVRRGQTVRLAQRALLPWHPCVMIAQTAVVRAVGGWPPFPVCEDFALTVALGAVKDGFAVDQTVHLYRKWGGQTTAKPGHTALIANWRPLAIARATQLAAAFD